MKETDFGVLVYLQNKEFFKNWMLVSTKRNELFIYVVVKENMHSNVEKETEIQIQRKNR